MILNKIYNMDLQSRYNEFYFHANIQGIEHLRKRIDKWQFSDKTMVKWIFLFLFFRKRN